MTGGELVQITPADASREEFLAARVQGLGSSDMAALVGLDKYTTSLSVYLDKVTDREEPEDDWGAEPDAAYWGSILEHPVADHFSRVNALPLLRAGTYARNGWQLASPDRFIVAEDGVPVPYSIRDNPVHPTWQEQQHPTYRQTTAHVVELYEGKTANQYLADAWKGGMVPEKYQVQCYWQMHVMGVERVWIAALIGGQQYVQVPIDRDQEIIDGLVEIGAAFWYDRVIPRLPPPLLGQPVDAALELIKSMHPVSIEDSRLNLDGDDAARFRQLLTWQQHHKMMARAHETAAKEYEVGMREIMGDFESAWDGDERLAKLTNIAASSYTVNRKASRRMYPAASFKPLQIQLDGPLPTPAPTTKEIDQ